MSGGLQFVSVVNLRNNAWSAKEASEMGIGEY